jgi:hypothetical protein
LQDNQLLEVGSPSLGFPVSEPGKLQIYIPKNTAFDIIYRDDNYLLYKSGVQARNTGSNIQFDASKTGILNYECSIPGYDHYGYFEFYIVFNNIKQNTNRLGLQGSVCTYNGTAISTGSYSAIIPIYTSTATHRGTLFFDSGRCARIL